MFDDSVWLRCVEVNISTIDASVRAMRNLVLVSALSLSVVGCAYPKHTAMVEVPNTKPIAHPVMPTRTADEAEEDRAAAEELAVTVVQAGLEVLLAILGARH